MNTLTAKQDRAVVALAGGATVSDAAEAAGVHRATLHRWLTLPEFSAALADVQRDGRVRAARRLSAALDRSAQIVIHLAETAEDESVRLRAAQAVPAMLQALADIEQVITAAALADKTITVEYVNNWRAVPTVFDHDEAVRAIVGHAEQVDGKGE